MGEFSRAPRGIVEKVALLPEEAVLETSLTPHVQVVRQRLPDAEPLLRSSGHVSEKKPQIDERSERRDPEEEEVEHARSLTNRPSPRNRCLRGPKGATGNS